MGEGFVAPGCEIGCWPEVPFRAPGATNHYQQHRISRRLVTAGPCKAQAENAFPLTRGRVVWLIVRMKTRAEKRGWKDITLARMQARLDEIDLKLAKYRLLNEERKEIIEAMAALSRPGAHTTLRTDDGNGSAPAPARVMSPPVSFGPMSPEALSALEKLPNPFTVEMLTKALNGQATEAYKFVAAWKTNGKIDTLPGMRGTYRRK